MHRDGFSRGAAVKLARALESVRHMRERAERAMTLFKQFADLASNDGRPFEPVDYDYDSLDNRDPEAVARVLRLVAEPMEAYFEAEVFGLSRVPEGSSLLVGNHSGGTWSPEIFLFGSALFRAGGLAQLPFGLAHASVVKIPPLARLLIPIGAVRACHENAARVFERGANVLVYPGGDEEAFRASVHRDRIMFGKRRGYVRLALRHGVPIVPVVTFGAHDVFYVLYDGRWLASQLGIDRLARMKVFPITFSLPWGFMVGGIIPFVPMPAKVAIEVLEPVRFARTGDAAASDAAYVEECAREVEARMQASLTGLALEYRYKQPELAGIVRHADNDQTGATCWRAA